MECVSAMTLMTNILAYALTNDMGSSIRADPPAAQVLLYFKSMSKCVSEHTPLPSPSPTSLARQLLHCLGCGRPQTLHCINIG